jgi:hypothetical protein
MKYVVGLLGLIFSAQSLGADVGISGAIGDGNEVRVPIRSGNYIFEPYLSHDSTSYDSNGRDYDISDTELGIALWRTSYLNDNLYLQYGAQLGYQKNKNDSSYSSAGAAGLYENAVSDHFDGFTFAPGLGLFYAFNSRFDVGLEVKYQYQKLSGDRKSSQANPPNYTWVENPVESGSSTNNTIETKAVVRLYF